MVLSNSAGQMSGLLLLLSAVRNENDNARMRCFVYKILLATLGQDCRKVMLMEMDMTRSSRAHRIIAVIHRSQQDVVSSSHRPSQLSSSQIGIQFCVVKLAIWVHVRRKQVIPGTFLVSSVDERLFFLALWTRVDLVAYCFCKSDAIIKKSDFDACKRS